MKKFNFILFLLLLSSLTFYGGTVSAKEKVVEDPAAKQGHSVDLKVEKSTAYYNSLSGERIEYTPENELLIAKTKLEDMVKYKKLTGKSISYEEVGLRDTDNSKKTTKFHTLSSLSPTEPATNDKLLIAQQVFYKGTSGSNYKYQYHSYAEWFKTPINHKKDAFATAWDTSAVPLSGTFEGYWQQQKAVADGNGGIKYVTEDKKLSADPDSYKNYGHGVILAPGYGDTQFMTMDRDILVPQSKKGDPANIITKYHHTYATISGVAISVGPAAITFSGSWGDDLVTEYSFTYGDR
ncbi:hypothetical protein HOO54_17015 [Bacillus sp. WMMC1349]|uniref:hypothetical protein n=1 Tax=Bacillus sp. WMMC1349 TaxID=2736254 RepID=UPI001551ABF2|nr:hypothetical protein [Bacillus sp. WMMC1349]NPC93871.1 hypothetical protein [Bacillus sp. WMMC1349]